MPPSPLPLFKFDAALAEFMAQEMPLTGSPKQENNPPPNLDPSQARC
ncbi:hypothetical protein FVEN_g13107 [Fusarium venenatum]|nr:hypothetical protein FVEN_g13107 [Fusarium venenatum]